MASSSATPPAGSTPPLTIGEHPKTPKVRSTASIEAVVDVPVVPPSILGEAADPREGFVFLLVDPWYEIFSLFPCKSFDFPFSPEDWKWTVMGLEVMEDRAWVPCLDEIFDLLIQKEDIQPIPINFEFPCAASRIGTPNLSVRCCGGGVPPPIPSSSQEKEIAVTLQGYSSTRVIGWPALFLHHENIPVRRTAFIVYWLCKCVFGNFPYYALDLLHDCEVEGDYCHIIVTAFNTTALQTFLWEHSVNYIFATKDKAAAWGLEFTPYCAQRVKRQFGLDQDVFASLQEATPSSPSLAPFIKSRAFAYWEGKVNRFAIAYGNSQKVGFAEWDETRSGWIAYTIHFPEGWKESVNVIEERLVMPSKRGKGSKRDVPVDSDVEKGSKKRAHSPKKASSKKTKAGKKSKSTAPVPRPEKESATTLSKIAASSKVGMKSVPLHPSKDQRKPATSSFSPDEEQPSAILAHSPPKKKKSIGPLSSAATRTRSKSASVIKRTSSKATRKSGGPSGAVVVVEVTLTHSFFADDISTSFSDGDDPLAAATYQGKDMGRSFEGNFEANVGSTEGRHSIASDSFSDIAPKEVLKHFYMNKTYPLNTPIVDWSLDVKKNHFRP
uniref:Aminotransferase-like plant mobile domain-containing protein n=1 Tax=Fagus sylvatica TaxID=28930 RepID=A0A2N9IJU8_FAGSY